MAKILVAVKGNREYPVTNETKARFEKEGFKIVSIDVKDTPEAEKE